MVRTNSLFTMFLVWLTTIIGFTWMVNANDDNCVITWPDCEPSEGLPDQYDPWGDEEAKDNYRRSTDPDNPNLYTDEDGCTWVTRGLGAARICPSNDNSDDDGSSDINPVIEPETICYSTEWGSWYVDRIHSVTPTFHSHSSNYAVAGHPVHGVFSVVTRYSEKRDGRTPCDVYEGDILIDSYYEFKTETRGPTNTVEFQSITLTDPFDDLHILSMNEETGEVILQWKERHTAYRMRVDVTLFESSTRSGLVVQSYKWPSREDTNSIEVRSIHGSLQ